MKTSLPFYKVLFAIVLILAVNSNMLSAQSFSTNGCSITSKSVVSLDGEWLIDKDPLNIGKAENGGKLGSRR